MNRFVFDIFELSPLFAEQQDGRMLMYSLWIGFGILTILAAILIWTRWGQAKPLSKCIALSIFAHVLLGGYAYGTRLIFNYSNSSKEAPVAFSIVEEVEQPELKPDETLPIEQESEKPWEKFADSPTDAPPTISTPKLESHQATIPKREARKSPVLFQDHQLRKEIDDSIAQHPAPDLPDDEIDVAPGPTIGRTEPAKIAEQTVPTDVAPKKRGPSTDSDPETAVPKSVSIEKLVDAESVKAPTPSAAIQAPKVTSDHLKQDLQNQVPVEKVAMVPGPREIEDANSVPDPIQSSKFRNVAQENRQEVNPAQRESTTKKQRRRLVDGQPIPQIYQNRFSPNRAKLLELNGGRPESQKAVEEALKWLSSEQSDNGSWNPRRFNAGNETNVYGHNRGGAGFNADTGITGLVILSFLGAGHTHLEGPYQKTVQKGLEYLIRTQKQDGSMFGDAGLFARTYCHGMALMAIAEAYAITGDHRIKPFIEKGQRYTVSSQNKMTGGWRYRAGDDGDMSQFGWQVMALKSCELAGLPIPDKTRNLMVRFLKNYSKGKSGGLSSYRPAEKISRTMTAEALFCRRLLGMNVSRDASAEAAAFVMEELPGTTQVDNLYFWYYATLALHEEQAVFNFQKQNWKKWNQKLTERILELQVNQKGQKGSFSNKTLWSAYGGTFYSTAMSTLCLEAHYRYKSESKTGSRTARR